MTQRSHSPTPSPVPAVSAPASTRDEAFALAVAHAEQTHPGVTFSLVEETQGGGRSGPWVFQLSAPAPPLLVQYKSANVIEIAPNANGLRAAVYAWEVQTYGHGQK